MNAEFNFKTLTEFTDFFKDEETCVKHYAGIRWANGHYCPHCGETEIYTFKDGVVGYFEISSVKADSSSIFHT